MQKYVQITINVPIEELEITGSVDQYYEPVEFWGQKGHEPMLDVVIDEVRFQDYEVVDYSEDEIQNILINRM
jgi:hypothetical protein